MANTVKTTKKENLVALMDLIAQAEDNGFEGWDFAELRKYCETEITNLDARAEKAKARNAAKKAEGDSLAEDVLAVLTDEYATADEVTEALNDADVTRAKVIYRLNKLVEAGDAEKADITVEGEDGKKRKVKGFRLVQVEANIPCDADLLD